MKFKTASNINGTSLQGYIEATYSELVAVFGVPSYGPDDADSDKVTCSWELELEGGVVATIYDWKMDKTPRDTYRWHIGGYKASSVELVTTLFNELKPVFNTYRVSYSYQVSGIMNIQAASQQEAEELAMEASINNRDNESYVDDTFEIVFVRNI